MIYKQFESQLDAIPVPSRSNRLSRLEYRNMEKAVTERFHIALSKEYGTIGNPKEELLFQHAWDLGHASGYYEVENHYTDLADLIK